MLELHDVSVTYGRVQATREASLVVPQGGICTLVGANGAGKSSLLRAVVGLQRPASGRIEFGGQSLVGLSPERIARRGISIVPEGRQAFTRLTVEENLRIGLTIRPDRRRAAADLDVMLSRFPVLRRYLHRSAGGLSGGEQQQLVIARALLSRPALLILDEPSLGLSPLMVDLVFQTLADLRRDGVTILLVEQNAARALELADTAYLMSNGRVTPRDTTASQDELVSVYLGDTP